MKPYPMGLLVDGRRVLVVGGGVVASRRVPALLDAGADVVVVAPEVTAALHALATAGRLRHEPRGFEPADVEGAWLVHVAVDDPEVAEAVSVAAESHRVFCVRADDRTAATAWTPAVTRHGPVTVAVTAGGDPRRAMAVRDAISTGLHDGSLDALDDPPTELGSVKPGGSGGASGAGDDRASSGGGPDGRTATYRPIGVALIGAGPGDPELITVRGRRLLRRAEVVVADHLIPGLLLDELRPDVELIDASKLPYGPSKAQDEINRILVDRASAGRFVVRLKGGDPFVFGRGGEEVLACVEAGIPVTVVPGITSAIAVPAAAGIPVTHRGMVHEFVVVSGHLPPDHPESLVDWPGLGRLRGTVTVLMGQKNAAAIAATLIAHGRPPTTPVSVVADGTTAHQRVRATTLAGLGTAVDGVRPPMIIVIGAVVTALDGWVPATSG